MKNVLAVADGGPALEATVAAAAYLSGLVKGQLDVLHVRDSLSLAGNLAVAAMAEGASALIIEDSQGAVAERSARARKVFDQLTPSLPHARFIDRDGDEADMVVAQGRVSDIVVVGRPGVDDRKPEPAYVRAAIYESSRPVMIVPPAWQPGAFERALVAWNGSAQAARALGYAIPILQRIPNVTVLSVGAADDRAPTEAVIRYLDGNGVKAVPAAFDAGSGSARARGRALLQHVASVGANLMVMGAYGEDSVLSFLGLGGATGKIITACKAPVFLAR